MKTNILFILICSLASVCLIAQEDMQYNFPKANLKYFALANLSGPIQVTGYAGEEIRVKATILEGKEITEVKIDYIQEDDYLLFYLDTPCNIPKSKMYFDPREPMLYQHWIDNCRWSEDGMNALPVYSFEVKVPDNIHVYTQTLTEGKVKITGIMAEVSAQNIEGDIILEDVREVKTAKTIDGDISITYTQLGEKESDIHAFNGDIHITLPKNSSCEIEFKSFNGDLYTDMDYWELAAKRGKTASTEKGFEFKLSKGKRVQLGSSDPKGINPFMSLETFNGDVYIKKSI